MRLQGSAEGRSRLHPLMCPLASVHHHTEHARPSEQQNRRGGRTDRKTPKGPRINRDGGRSDNPNICGQQINIQSVRHFKCAVGRSCRCHSDMGWKEHARIAIKWSFNLGLWGLWSEH